MVEVISVACRASMGLAFKASLDPKHAGGNHPRPPWWVVEWAEWQWISLLIQGTGGAIDGSMGERPFTPPVPTF